MPAGSVVGSNAVQNSLMEKTFQPLYSHEQVTAATLQIDFFTNPIGEPAARTLLDTNMISAGVLPYPYSFTVKAMRVVPMLGIPLADLILILDTSYINFIIQEKSYLLVPTKFIGAGIGIQGPGSAAPLQFEWTNGSSDNSSVRVIDPFIEIGSQQNFRVSLIFPAAPAALTAAVELYIYLDGVQTRVVQ